MLPPWVGTRGSVNVLLCFFLGGGGLDLQKWRSLHWTIPVICNFKAAPAQLDGREVACLIDQAGGPGAQANKQEGEHGPITCCE